MNTLPQPNNRATRQTGQSARTFTPIYDDLIEQYGLIAAAIYGRISRYCQGQSGTCYAPHEAIADQLGVTERTVRNHAAKLVEAGLLLRSRKRKNQRYTYSLPGNKPIKEAQIAVDPDSFTRKEIPRHAESSSASTKRQVKETVLASEVREFNNNKSANTEAGSLSLLTAKLKTFDLSKRWIKANLNKHGEGRLWEVLNALEREERDNPPGWATDALQY